MLRANVAIFVVFVAVFVLVIPSVDAGSRSQYRSALQPMFTIVESIPKQVNLRTLNTTYESWRKLISEASHSIVFAEFYWTLTDGVACGEPCGGLDGAHLFDEIRSAHNERGVHIRIIQNQPGGTFPGTDTERLAREGVAEVRTMNFKDLSPEISSGIFHTKLIVVDGAHFYIGSANMDWRSLTQVKELGAVVENCPELAADLLKMFEMWWEAAGLKTLPKMWSPKLEAQYNANNPALINFKGDMKSRVYFSVSPPQFKAPGRDVADFTTVDVINRATRFIDIEVMDYRPASLYASTNYYWPEIDDALRSAAFRGVKVRLLVSMWNHTSRSMRQYVDSLNSLNNTSVRWFIVPEMEGVEPIPFTRVNHAKFMVTDREAYISNNNWTADYFKTTAGVTMVIANDRVVAQLHHKVFERDWNSVYSHPL